MSYKLKVLLCGSNGEKSKLVNRFVQSKFSNDYKLTVGVDIFTKNVILKTKNENCTLSIWDIGSNERFSFIRTTFYKGAAAAIIVFDLSRDTTWEKIQKYYEEIKSFAGEIPIAFVEKGNGENGNEKREKFRNLIESTGNSYYKTSSKGENMEHVFSSLAERTVGISA
jgi:GTPase SAR1 family protein